MSVVKFLPTFKQIEPENLYGLTMGYVVAQTPAKLSSDGALPTVDVNGVKFIHVRAGIGTHLYNTKEMSQFIDGVVQEAQNLDIETKTPNEIAELKSLWEKENG